MNTGLQKSISTETGNAIERQRSGRTPSEVFRRSGREPPHRISIVLIAALATLPIPALAHECRVVGNPYLRGHYHGDCDEGSETAQGRGEATGADSYVGSFLKGRPDGKGLYTWENGAKLEGIFKAGKANGPGLYISAKGVRYDGRFENGKLNGAAPDDCPVTKGPLTC